MTAPSALYYGDNLDILRHHIGADTVDLVYLDPPFNSNRDYNVLFREKSGEASSAQIEAFTDTWAARETIHPETTNGGQVAEASRSEEPIVFPSPHGRRLRCGD